MYTTLANVKKSYSQENRESRVDHAEDWILYRPFNT